MSSPRVRFPQLRNQPEYGPVPTSHNNFEDGDNGGFEQTSSWPRSDSNKHKWAKLQTLEVQEDHAHSGRWAIHWTSPVAMILLFLAGTALAVGHHMYYRSLNGQEVNNVASKWDLVAVKNNQEWKIRFGTAFAFVVEATLAATVACAYKQSIWRTARGATITIQGLDALFAADHNIMSFFSLDYLSGAPLPFFLAVLIWVIPLSALVTPATLTVIPRIKYPFQMMSVPTVDFSMVDPLYNYNASTLGSDYNTADNGVTPYMSRLVAATASQLDILPMRAVAVNATYDLTFRGPSLQCKSPATDVNDVIHQVVNISHMLTDNGNHAMKTDFDTNLAWVAFAPVSPILSFMADGVSYDFSDNSTNSPWNLTAAFTQLCVIGRNAVMTSFATSINTNSVQCEGITDSGSSYNNGTIWIWAQNNTYDCRLRDTEFRVNFFAQNDGQRINTSYQYIYTADPPHGSYFAITNAIANWLTGAVNGFEQGISSYKTRITETALFGALHVTNVGNTANNYGLAPNVLPPAVTALARNLSVGALVEELSRNVTLSLFSADQVLSTNGTVSNVTMPRSVNVYDYNRDNLIVTYAITWVFALVGLIVGLVQLVRNGVSHDTSFSSVIMTTRNHNLDSLVQGQSLGATPMDQRLAKTKLRFGVLENSHATNGGVKRVGFGHPTEVRQLVKGEPYY